MIATVLALLALLASATLIAAVEPPGPPYPPPVEGQRVYDTAGVLSPSDIAYATARIEAIEQRTGVEIVVYTQVKPESDTPDLAQADADALGTQWGVGRKGFDDGLVILFDMDTSLCHGQVRLDAGAGYASTYLSNSERDAIYENDMLPLLEQCDIGGALRVAIDKVDAAATPQHAADLDRARQIDALLGLIVAPLLFVVLVVLASWRWVRHGRDPVYLDDPSIHLPAPPADLTPAAAALVWDGRSSRHTLTTALLDLASHGQLSFREEQTGTLVHHTKIGIETSPTVADSPELTLVRRRPLGAAETSLATRIGQLPGVDGTGYLDPPHVPAVSGLTTRFDTDLEAGAVASGWFSGPPTKVIQRWYRWSALEFVGGIAAIIAGANMPSQGVLLVGVALTAAGVVTHLVGRQMPARTKDGAMIRAMLAAYRRTLDKTMAQARSLRQVVDEAQLSWLETPDQAFVWGVALGLQSAVQAVLDRSFADVGAGATAGTVWFPVWYATLPSGGGGAGWGAGGGQMSSSPIPNIGGMLAAIGTVGAAP
ncbi:MAG TPA: TPM domain-containing protein, partial [Candidatus Binatia bacterium]|nr:TPM domain-containing protein [Candidatus Binatia bacterium]